MLVNNEIIQNLDYNLYFIHDTISGSNFDRFIVSELNQLSRIYLYSKLNSRLLLLDNLQIVQVNIFLVFIIFINIIYFILIQ